MQPRFDFHRPRIRGRCFVGTAGWTLPAQAREPTRTYLQQYGTIFSCCEINSSFYRHHLPRTYARWAASVPSYFRFSVKVPRLITHEPQRYFATLGRFLDEIELLGGTLGPLLFQFPPGLSFSASMMDELLGQLRSRYSGAVVIEPRHASWGKDAARALLSSYAASIVAADPQPIAGAPSLADLQDSWYLRLHGSPHRYYSDYPDRVLEQLAPSIIEALAHGDVWCIFDNTAMGAAFYDAFAFQGLLNKMVPQLTPSPTSGPGP